MYPGTVKSYTSESEEQAVIVLQKTRGRKSIFSLWGGPRIPLVNLAASLIPPSLDVAEYERAVIIKIVQENLASHLVCPNDPSTSAVESNRLCGNYLPREMPCADGWGSGWEQGWFSMFSVRHSSSLKYFSSACRAISPSSLVGFASSITLIPHGVLAPVIPVPKEMLPALRAQPLQLPLCPIFLSSGQARHCYDSLRNTSWVI